MVTRKIAVLMSTYNGEKYLVDQIESILLQKGDFKITLIVRDDGSKDNTIDILEGYEKEGKLILVKGENLKPALSFMELLYNNTGYDYYAFSDQDDFWMDNKLESAIKFMNNDNGPCLYFSNAENVDENLESLGGVVYNKKPNIDFYSTLIGAHYLGCTMVFNKALADVVQSNPKPKYMSMHDSYLSRICVCINGKILYDSNAYMKYRQHSNNVIGSTVGKLDALKRRLEMIFCGNDITLDMQIQQIFENYNELIPEKNKKWLKHIRNYRKNFLDRMILVFSRKPKFNSLNMSITIRLQILCGKR